MKNMEIKIQKLITNILISSLLVSLWLGGSIVNILFYYTPMTIFIVVAIGIALGVIIPLLIVFVNEFDKN